ncbi:MAG: hypothetical protein NC084_06160 [Bacteroides sp.]|nr:hypothetical protein [Eubacterium sp.]MCM1418191.1 hypothetical protein [Roseburia sp.]MCM1462284.1 hypothetical protein [Bacteroides sp.]
MNKTNRNNWISLIVTLIITILVIVVLCESSVLSLHNVQSLGNDFQYNIISTSSTIAGFLFTAISILLSALNKDRIKRLWENHYLDNLYRFAFVGIVANIISIIVAIVILCFSIAETFAWMVAMIEMVSLAVGIVFFTCCTFKLLRLVNKMKTD